MMNRVETKKNVFGLNASTFLLVLLSLVQSNDLAAAEDKNLFCTESVDAWVSQENGGMFSKPGIRGGHDNKPKNPLKLQITLNGKTGRIVGPHGNSELTAIAPNTYSETAERGNVIIWTLVENTDGVFFVKQNAVNLMGLSAFTVVFTCGK